MRAGWSGVGASHFIRFRESLLFMLLFIVFHGIRRAERCIGRRMTVRAGGRSREAGDRHGSTKDRRDASRQLALASPSHVVPEQNVPSRNQEVQVLRTLKT